MTPSTTTWPVPPCPHATLWMENTRECAVCWMVRMAAETQPTATPNRKARKERAR